MKKRLLCITMLLLCAVLITSLAWAGRLRRGGGVAAPVCSTSTDSVLQSYSETNYATNRTIYNGSTLPGQSFQHDANFTMTSIRFSACWVVNGTVTVTLYNDSSGNQGTVIADSAMTVSGLAECGTPGYVTGELATPISLLANTTYHFQVTRSAGSVIQVGADNTEPTYANGQMTDNGTAQAAIDLSGWEILGCED